MELKIKDYQLPAPIVFNYEELKAELVAKMQDYQTTVYTEDKVAEAKKDRAKLNGLKKTLNDERIRREKEYLQPFQTFKNQVNEIIGIIDKPIGIIDRQIKGFEEDQKATKREQIGSIWQNITHPEWLTLPKVFNEKWLNKTVTIKSIELELIDKVAQINRDLDTIKALDSFAFEAETEYKRTLDLAKAIEEGKKQADTQRRKEEEQKAREEEARKAQADMPKTEVRFWANVTVMQAQALKEFFKTNGIEYGPITEEGDRTWR